MYQSADLHTDLELVNRRLRAASAGSAEFGRLTDELSAVGLRITASIEEAFLELTDEQSEAA